MCNVPNAFVCTEVKVIIRILNFTRFFKNTAIILNTTVYELLSLPCKVHVDLKGVITYMMQPNY